MKHKELLLSNYSFILELIKAGFQIRQITQDVNRKLDIQITQRQLQYLIDRVNNNTIHKEYDNIVLIDHTRDAWDTRLGEYCVEFHGLLITYKSAAYLTNPKYIITPDNLITVTSQESVIYAKRLLKLYHIPDADLLKQHKIIHPKQQDIDLANLTYKIRLEFNNEFARMLVDLRNRYVDFLSNNIKGTCNEK